MSDKNVKLLRGQVRQVVKEQLPGVLSAEVIEAIQAKLQKEMADRLDNVMGLMKETLDRVDQRSKEVQSYLVRATTPQAPAPQEAVEIPVSSDK